MQRQQHRQITVSEMSPHIHRFAYGENKVDKISSWLINWIRFSLECGNIKPYDMLPTKGALAFHIGVSKGTMQNVFRYVEDCGYIESKQRVGTYICFKKKGKNTEKLTSKREFAAEVIKKFLVENNYKTGDKLISTRKLSTLTGVSVATIRIAMNSLISDGIIEKHNNAFIVSSSCIKYNEVQVETLVEKTATKLKKYIEENFKTNERIPANNELAKVFKVSVKTIHDAVKQLVKDGILSTRRGQYGTIYSKNFENVMYEYERVEFKLRHYISEHCKIGTKLPSMVVFSKQFDTSTKTIKKALDNLADEGYITCTRGRYGGTFVTDMPQSTNEAYKWLALSPEYSISMEKLEN